MTLRPAAATRIAGNFPGEEEERLAAGQVEDVAKELANMICGAALSRIESSANFGLAAPGNRPDSLPEISGTGWAVCTVETGNGLVTAAIAMEARTCSLSKRSGS